MLYITYDNETGKVDEVAFSSLEMIPQGKSYLEISEEAWNNAQGKIMKVVDGKFVSSEPPPTVADYDKVIEDHLKTQRVLRGYAVRQPSDYKDSTVQRWAQDASDWISHRDQVMLYGLEVQNGYQAGQPVPTLQEFKALLPKIEWTIE